MRGFGIFLIVVLAVAAAIDVIIVVFVDDDSFPANIAWPLERDRKAMALALFGKLVLLTHIWMTLPQE